MKKKLLLFLSKYSLRENSVIAPTLAWLAMSKGYIYDNYFDSYHLGCHFPGGDARNLDYGQLTGGTVCGDRHFEEFYFLLHSFDVFIVAHKDSMFFPFLRNLNIPMITLSSNMNSFYEEVFTSLDSPIAANVVLCGSHFDEGLKGIEKYLYPEILHRKAIGLLDSATEKELIEICKPERKMYCVFVSRDILKKLERMGIDYEVIDHIEKNDDYLSITKRIALRWENKAKGYILGDPTLVAYWLPKATEENLLSVYSVPQEKIIDEMGDQISFKGKVVYGRQYSDRDFFELSKRNQSLQVIDPCRPPFQSLRHVHYSWHPDRNEDGFYEPEYTDEELRAFAKTGRVLISLMFWSGMIREMANFYNLLDLFAMTKLRCGLVLTAQTYEYGMHSALELITIPLEQGGAFPLIEPVLGSCGIGVGIEAYITEQRLREDLEESLEMVGKRVTNQNYLPRGWWPTMDSELTKLPFHKRPKPFKFLRYSPFLQIRYNPENHYYKGNKLQRDSEDSGKVTYKERLKQAVINAGLNKYFDQIRPYESYQAGPLKRSVVETAKNAGLQYMFTKAGFNRNPEILYNEDNFVALNYTSGQWDGWTPFETVNDVSDLKKTEKKLLKRKKPGWIVSTIDSCLWTFSGEFWKRGSRLFEIGKFCSSGGKSGRLINVKPYTIARYARLIAEKNNGSL